MLPVPKEEAMRGFLEKAGAAREAAADLRRRLATTDPSVAGPTLKRCDNLDARGAELEYRWFTLAKSSPDVPGKKRGWRLLLRKPT
jgi:hypothetical protein